METLCKRATSVAHLTNFSFEFFYEIFTEAACLSTSSIPWCKKVKNDQKLISRGGGGEQHWWVPDNARVRYAFGYINAVSSVHLQQWPPLFSKTLSQYHTHEVSGIVSTSRNSTAKACHCTGGVLARYCVSASTDATALTFKRADIWSPVMSATSDLSSTQTATSAGILDYQMPHNYCRMIAASSFPDCSKAYLDQK